jgi:hypothetical protein
MYVHLWVVRFISPPILVENRWQWYQFVLTKNAFEFNSQVYLQVAGTAIGTRMAPTYAIIFMHMLETKILTSATYEPLSWLRFIDDVWSASTHGKEKLLSFIQHLNQSYPAIKFTWEASDSLVHFLDVNTRLKDSIITADLYVKPTDTHQYLHPDSGYPGHIKRSIPLSQTLRISDQNATQQISVFKNLLSTSPRGDIVKTKSRDKFTKLNRSLKSVLPQHPSLHLCNFPQGVIPKPPINNMGRPT